MFNEIRTRVLFLLLASQVSVMGQTNYSLSFDGVDDYLQIPNSDALNFGTGSFTIGVAVKTPNPSQESFVRVLTKNTGTWIDFGPYTFAFYGANNSLRFGFAHAYDSNRQVYTTITADAWEHFVGVYNATDKKLIMYKNGTKVDSLVTEDTPVQNTKDVTIGSAQSVYSYFQGHLDEVAMWNTALAASEIAALYNSGNLIDASSSFGSYASSASVKGYWRFNEGTGSTVSDLSGNDNDGAIYGATWSTDVPATDTTAPAAPTGLTATPGDAQVTLRWNKNSESDVAKYRIYGGTSASPTTGIDSTSSVSDTIKTIIGLTNGTTYYYRVTAVDTAQNESEFSEEVSARPRYGTIIVKLDGVGDFTAIQNAIDAASTADTILVYPGKYVENINLHGKNLVMVSSDGVDSTIIDGNQNGSVITINSGEDSTTVISGFKLTNGNASYGAGISCSNASPRLENLILEANSADFGGGINIAGAGAEPTLSNMLVINNKVQFEGGGVAIWNGQPSIINITVVENDHDGIWLYDGATLTVKNSIVWNNGEISIGMQSGPNTVNISYTDIQGGRDGIVTDPVDVINCGAGNLDVDPLFADPASKDYRLSRYSPSIGAGTLEGAPTTDINGDARPHPPNSNPDLGAYENTLSMLAPLPFELAFPYDNTTIEITRDNKWTDTLYFAWEQPANYTAEQLSYSLQLTGDLAFIIMPPPTLNMTKLAFNHVEYYIHNAGLEIATGTWNVVASNGESTTGAVNEPFNLTIDASAVGIDKADLIPESFALHQNYPNPFNPVTTLRYDLPNRSEVVLSIYDILGRQIRTLVKGVEEPGFKSVVWDGTDDRGQTVGAGVYLYQIQAGDFVQTRKMVLLR